jgi:hypothetical protein
MACCLRAQILVIIVIAGKTGQYIFCSRNFFLSHFNIKKTSPTFLEHLQINPSTQKGFRNLKSNIKTLKHHHQTILKLMETKQIYSNNKK